MTITVPAGLRESAAAAFGAAGIRWCADLPGIVAEYLDRWQLTLDLPTDREPWAGFCGIVVPVRRVSGEPAVIKVSWIDDETAHEHVALAVWAGRGAVRLIAADGPRRVLLLERLDGDRDLNTLPVDDAVDVVARLLRRLAVPAPPELERVDDRAARWVEELPRRWREAGLATGSLALQYAVESARRLGSLGDDLLVHSDLHYGNVLAAPGEPDRWVAIDPKPMAGALEFGVLPALWNRLDELDPADREADLLRRLRRFCATAGLDVGTARAWSVTRAVETVVWNAEIGMEQEVHRPAWIAETLTAGA